MKIEEQVSLARYTSMHVGGPAAYFIGVHSDAETLEALAFASDKRLPIFILGKGSNTIFSDAGWPGVVLHMEDRTMTVAPPRLTAASGVFMRQLVNKALSANLRGLEELAGIPGTVGGAVRGNAGTWNTETKDHLESVDVLELVGEKWQLRTLRKAECAFGYRDSLFKQQQNFVILRAHFVLTAGDAQEGQRLVQEDLRKRHERQPYDAPSAGSIFKNPTPGQQPGAGALIEQVGLKGTKHGGAEISPKHANFIVNRGTATSSDVRALIAEAQKKVKAATSISLEPEIVLVN